MTDMILHNYFRSSTSFRVRAALNLKGLDYEYVSYHLRRGEQSSDDFIAVNPQGLVPALQTPEAVLTQSLAIIEYLDEIRPEPPLLPADALGRARVRSLAMIVACDIHPINNLRVLGELRRRFSADDDGLANWFRHWVATSFRALEARLADEPETGRFCHGDTAGLADICLAGQVINNGRFDVDMTQYPTIERIYAECMSIVAFEKAHPAVQPDAE